MERFTGMGFIRLCSSVHNIEITLLQVQNTEKQTYDPSSVPSL